MSSRRAKHNPEEDPVFVHPESYGIENLEEPGEPDRSKLPPSEPVPGTGRRAREKHMRRHEEGDHERPRFPKKQ